MTLRDFLSQTLGVWDGIYTHLSPDGEVVERFPSRQELRLDGTRWYERIVYRPGSAEESVNDFRGELDASGQLQLGMAGFTGRAVLIDHRTLFFTGEWHESGIRVNELVALTGEHAKVRLWQRFHGSELVGCSIIRETRRVGAVPAQWH